jgi:putative ABC transport system permease protein
MKYVFKELYRHKWRTTAGISGYLIASLFIMLILSLNYSAQNDSVGILKSTGTHFIVYLPSGSSCCAPGSAHATDGSLIAEGGYTMMLNSEVIGTLKDVPGVKDAAPYLLYRLFDRKLNCGISLGGIDTAAIATKSNVCAANNLIEGTYLTGNRGEIVAEESFAMAHKLKVGDTLQTFGGKLIIGGIVNSGIKPGKADLYAPIEHVREILKDSLNCISEGFDMNIILVEVADARIQTRVMNDIKNQLNFLSVSSYNCYQPASDVMGIIESAGTFMSVLIFMFLIVFSAKTQLTNLMERYREIGILKSLGWKDSSLSLRIIATSLIQALTGSVIGILLGLVIAYFLNINSVRVFKSMQFLIQTENIPVLILLSLAGAIIATILPIIKLNRAQAGEMINSFN